MKKTSTLLVLLFIMSISMLIKNYIHVSGNTFTMPSDNKENNPYHTYNIENNKNKPVNKKTNNKNYNNTKGSNNSNPQANKSNNTYSQENTNIYNYSTNTPSNKSHNNSHKTKNNNYNNIKNKIKENKSTPMPESTHIPESKTIPPAGNASLSGRQKTCKKKTKNTITKIEFQKHFIKIAPGDCENILFTTVPSKNPGLNFIYKSTDNSIATFKNKKLTGIKKGFTTIIIMLPDGTIKAACPVKVI